MPCLFYDPPESLKNVSGCFCIPVFSAKVQAEYLSHIPYPRKVKSSIRNPSPQARILSLCPWNKKQEIFCDRSQNISCFPACITKQIPNSFRGCYTSTPRRHFATWHCKWKACFLARKKMLLIDRKNHYNFITSRSPDLCSTLSNPFPDKCPVVSSLTFGKLTITVTGSHRIHTGFPVSPFGTCNSWFKTNKCY